MKKNYKIYIIIGVIVLAVILGIFGWNKIMKSQDKKDSSKNEYVEVIDANNVSIVDAKLGEDDVRITQSYLLNYAVRKVGTWYQSSGYVKSIKESNRECIITLSENKNSNLEIIGTIDSDSCNVKKGDTVNFMGTISLKTGNINLAKITTDEINYESPIKLEYAELVNNFKNVSNTYFVVSGYMVTEPEVYKLFDSKSAYKKDSSAGNYFLINWKNGLDYTGNADVKIRCLLIDTYKLGDCTLEK